MTSPLRTMSAAALQRELERESDPRKLYELRNEQRRRDNLGWRYDAPRAAYFCGFKTFVRSIY